MFSSIKNIKSFLIVIFMVSAGALVFAAGGAEDDVIPAGQPTEDVEFVVHNSAGSGTDLFVRTVARALNENNLVPTRVNVVNRPGSGGLDARRYLANQSGCNVLAGATQTWITRGAINPNDYDYTHFTPVAHLVGEPLGLLVQAGDRRYDNLRDLVDAARVDPGGVAIAGPAVGSVEWMAKSILEQTQDVEFNFISFQEGGSIIPQLLGGHVDFIFANIGQAAQYVESGDLEFLGILTRERIDQYPEVPTFEEAGIDIGMELFGPRGFYGPSDMSEECQVFWHEAFEQALQTEIMVEWMENTGNSVIFRAGDDYIDFIVSFQERVIPILSAAGLLD